MSSTSSSASDLLPMPATLAQQASRYEAWPRHLYSMGRVAQSCIGGMAVVVSSQHITGVSTRARGGVEPSRPVDERRRTGCDGVAHTVGNAAWSGDRDCPR